MRSWWDICYFWFFLHSWQIWCNMRLLSQTPIPVSCDLIFGVPLTPLDIVIRILLLMWCDLDFSLKNILFICQAAVRSSVQSCPLTMMQLNIRKLISMLISFLMFNCIIVKGQLCTLDLTAAWQIKRMFLRLKSRSHHIKSSMRMTISNGVRGTPNIRSQDTGIGVCDNNLILHHICQECKKNQK